ncbi:tRNA pseudouridine(55) synthase TruB [Candidatus Blochmannia ocreatus (nom. nud.)]|uniref:tRNA pseudouridine(55) synthase TruB n=1 Tax=Candidatus Blochmannia ocreatus (nom. nud.) TaxID=251538 RepID=UPI0024E12D6B|nr:tRNA pseudouridine(55) synthase TruB [Candidatus Blochmannia ocreatus]
MLLDKIKGVSSGTLLNKIKYFFCARKVGHAGTLDPIATGMFVICFGKATKLAKYLLNFDKKYKVVAKLGISTNTFDSDGKIRRISPVRLHDNELKQCIQSFIGIKKQIPPMFSALKHNGVPLYKYARQGIEITRKPRNVHIYDCRLLKKSNDIIELYIYCSKGTYVRSIINDIGEYLSCGAHVIELRRLSIGYFECSSMVTFKNLENIYYNNAFSDLEVLRKLDTLLVSVDNIKNMCMTINT